MSSYLVNNKDFRYIAADDTQVQVIYGNYENKAGLLTRIPKKKGRAQNKLIAKYIKDYKKRGFKESEDSFDSNCLTIIDIEKYMLPKCKYSTYLENKELNRFYEIGVLNNEIIFREGYIGGLGFQSKRKYGDKIKAENIYFEEPKKWKKKGYKEILSGAGFPQLKQALLDLKQKDDLEQERKKKLYDNNDYRGVESIEEQVFLQDYKHYLFQGPYRENFAEWPACLKHLKTVSKHIKAESPPFIRDSFKEHGIEKQEEMNIPVRITSVLGECPIHQFVSCPNIPEYYYDVQYKQLKGMNDKEILEKGISIIQDMSTSHFFWFDGEILDGANKPIPVRCVYNPGDPDSNEGLYGAVWHRDTRQLVADIKSNGDTETIIEASSTFCTVYIAHNTWFPEYSDPEKFRNPVFSNVLYKKEHELEKLVHILILLHWFS